jgi:hypothetical protein
LSKSKSITGLDDIQIQMHNDDLVEDNFERGPLLIPSDLAIEINLKAERAPNTARTAKYQSSMQQK